MSEKLGRTRKIVEKRYKDEIRKLSLYWPAETVTLEEANEGKLTIRLQGGGTHSFSKDEVEKLLKDIPPFLWPYLRLPLLLRYETVGTVSYYRVLGSRWQRRLAEIMLRGSYTYEGLEKLKVSEFREILKRYKSLVFVGLSV
ncbi:MAG: DUF61 family protein [Desulfurococcales archaeon]|nr:DUF61 family protein [Desulfurococcales archaeon]